MRKKALVVDIIINNPPCFMVIAFLLRLLKIDRCKSGVVQYRLGLFLFLSNFIKLMKI